MVALEIPELKDVFTGELAERANWLVANLETNISWPVSAQSVAFRGLEYWLVPVTRQSSPAIALRLGDLTAEEGQRRLLRLLSAISWRQGAGITCIGFTGGSLPRPMSREKSTGLVITADLDISGLPEPDDPKAQLALALMREGWSLNHPGYAFLSFYRVLEVCLPAEQRKSWLTDNADKICDHVAKQALHELRATGVLDVGRHLYRSGRQAIAHATSHPIVDPDEPEDMRRLRAELPIIRALAQIAIETRLGVVTPHTEWREHLYELAGFKRLFGDELVDRIKRGEQPVDGQTINLPIIDVELRRRSPYLPLERLNPVYVGQIDRRAHVVFESGDHLVQIEFVLDFAAERLRFDWENAIHSGDDGSVQAARNAAEVTRFLRDYLGNGELHIYDSDTRELLSKVDAFIPVNAFVNHDALNARIEKWEREAEKREGASKASLQA